MKTLSISIAAYNVQETLGKTLDSLNDKRILKDIEVLVVDDGSKDNTEKIATKYVNIAPDTFKYIKKENGGHGSTINRGMKEATGKYFKVIDGDDWVDTEEMVKFVKKLKRIDSDLVLTDFTEVYPTRKNKVNLVENAISGKEYTWNDDINVEKVVLHTVTVKTKLLQENRVHITENCFYVDVEFVVWAAYVAKTITYLNLYVYMYRLGEDEQSVNKKNMIKNIAMQEKVSYQLATLYGKFTNNSKLLVNQKRTILKTLKQSIGSTMRTYLLMDNSKKQIINFDTKLKTISPITYNALNTDSFIKAVRKYNYKLTPLIKISYKFWVMKKYGYKK